MSQEIWVIRPDPSLLNELGKNTMKEQLGIVFTEVGPNYLRATMPVDHRTVQYFGMLHGGASVALAETVASTAANFVLNPQTHYAIGLEINANHIRAVRDGSVWAHAEPIHLGRQTQVWSIYIRAVGSDQIVCVVRHTVIVQKK
jgi:1,4-dihydroxy-2-naphthoyl-CoA hydrolase